MRALRSVLLVVGLLGLGAPVSGFAVEIADIPKPQRWVSDLTASIPSTYGLEIEAIADRIERETGGQLVVVVMNTLGGKESRPFATELFNSWKIGRAKQNDGLLIFVALADHRVELLLGSGIDDPERQRASDEIMQQVMVPQFKAGNSNLALVLGVRECARRIYGLADPAASAPIPETLAQPLARKRGTEKRAGSLGTYLSFLTLGGLFVGLGWLARSGGRNWTRPFSNRSRHDSWAGTEWGSSGSDSGFSGSDSGSTDSGGGSTDGGGSSGHW